MHRIFAGLAAWVVLVFLAEFALGLTIGAARAEGDLEAAQAWFTWHMLTGIFLGTLCCVVHIMTMFHFVGSGKEIKEAAEVLGDDHDLARQVRRFKAQTFPWATFAPIVTGAAVILGGGAHMRAFPGWIHWAVGGAALALNLMAFPIEYKALRANLDLIEEVDRRLRRDVMPPLFGGRSE
ncbi:MAG: hypothetical protein HY716_08110 [Planctomycetes bacterium]|nr:hypothetical protein [Planctomycetota bacterium]